MPTDSLPNDLEALRVLVSQLSSERDAAVAENRRLIEQHDNLRHLLKMLRMPSLARSPSNWFMINCSWLWKISSCQAGCQGEEEASRGNASQALDRDSEEAAAQSRIAAGTFAAGLRDNRAGEHRLPLLSGANAHPLTEDQSVM